MSKNISRKGIAFGVAATVGFAGLTGALPAQAAELVTLSPIAGTSYNVPLDETFTLKTYFGAAAQEATTDMLKVRIVDASEALELGPDGPSSGLVIDGSPDVTSLEAFVDGVSITEVDDTAGVASLDKIKLVPSALTEKASVTVQTWVDANGDNIVDGDEAKSSVRTINFLSKDDIKASVAIADSTDFNSTDAEAKVVFSPALNLDLFANTSTKVLTLGDLDVTMGGYAADKLVLNSDGSVTATETTAVDDVDYVVEALLGTDSLGKSTKSVVDHDIDAAKSEFIATKSNNVAEAIEGVTAVRTGTKNTEAVFSIADSNDDAVGAGVLVRVTLDASHSNLATPSGSGAVADTIKVNGNLVKATDVTFNVKTDVNGQVKLPVAVTGATAGTKLNIDLEIEGDVVSDALELEWQDADYTAVTAVDASSNYRSIANGGSTSISFVVQDQFGVAIGSGARLAFVVDGSASDPVTSYVNLVGGKASIKVSDTTADASTSYTVDAELQTLDVDDENYYDYNTDAGITAAQHTVNVTDAALAWKTTAYVSTTDKTLQAPADAEIGVAANLDTDVEVTNPGAPVTLASKGVTFIVDGTEYADSVTVFTGETGAPAVSVKSNIAGKHTITYTAGSDVRTGLFTVLPAAADSGVKLTLTAPAKVLPGGVLVVSGKLTDKFGNPVDTAKSTEQSPTAYSFSVAYEDNGLGVIIGDLPVETDEAGKFNLRYSIAANQSGTAVVTVKYDADNTGTASAEISASKTVIINKSSTASASAGSKKITVRAKNSIGETVKVYVDGVLKSTKVATSNNYAITVSRLTAGKHTVKVVVSGKSVLNTRIVVKK